jgi:ribosomal-protein-alanine N-acetyltransferase
MRWWDIEALMPLEQELFGDTAWTAEMFWSELAHPETRWYVVAEDESQALGYAGLLAPGLEADVQTVAVAPSAQGRGVGRMLLDALVEQAQERAATSLLLEVRADNERAIDLYARRGFERIAIRQRYYQPGDIDAWIMRLRPLSTQS